ncbi:MAG: cyclase family protein, partial [Ruminiclostridium sp.]|nr:cyclase family protein [Ruminiclostridium sp.]
MIIDISQEIFSCRTFPGDPSPVCSHPMSTANGDICNLTEFSMCAHNGTHVDAPYHFISDGKTVDKVDLSVFVGDCYVAVRNGDLSPDDVISIMEAARSLDAAKRILVAG